MNEIKIGKDVYKKISEKKFNDSPDEDDELLFMLVDYFDGDPIAFFRKDRR